MQLPTVLYPALAAGLSHPGWTQLVRELDELALPLNVQELEPGRVQATRKHRRTTRQRDGCDGEHDLVKGVPIGELAGKVAAADHPQNTISGSSPQTRQGIGDRATHKAHVRADRDRQVAVGEDVHGPVPVEHPPLLRLLEQVLLAQYPLIGCRALHQHAYGRQELVEWGRLAPLDCKQPVQRMVLVCDVTGESSRSPVDDLPHRQTVSAASDRGVAGLTRASATRISRHPFRHDAPVPEQDWSRFPASVRRVLQRIQRRYSFVRRVERLLGDKRRSLANDALQVVLEWGPQARLSEVWRLQQRQPEESLNRIETALEAAHAIAHEAYELTDQAWPRDQREIASEVDRAAALAREALTRRHPDLDPGLLRRAVSQANYTHAK